MFDFDAGTLLIIGVVALIVIGPKELPRVLRQVGQAVGRLKRMASEFQGQFMDAMKEADIQSIRDEVTKLSADADLDMHFDPARDIQSELTKSIETASTDALPALADAPAAATDGFAVPLIGMADPDPGGTEPATLATVGVAPVAENGIETETGASPALNGLAGARRKRKIVLPKRRPAQVQTPHDVSDRTGLRGRPAGRPRRSEATER